MFNGAVVVWDLPEHPNGVITRFVVRYWNDAFPTDITVQEFEGSQRNLTIEGLSPSTHYTVDIMASTIKGDGPREETKFESGVPPGVPSGPPRNVRADVDGKRGVMVQWDSVDDEQKNGNIRGYEVTGLRAFTSYLVYASACTIVGCGPENRVPVVVLTPEDVPDVPTGVSFSLISENEVRLKWTPPENPNGKIKSYYVSYWKSSEDRSSAIRAPLSSTLLFFTANGLEPNKKYTFTVQAENSVGLGPEALVEVVTTSVRVPVHAPPMPTRNDTARYGAENIAIRWDTEPAREDDDAPVRFVQVFPDVPTGVSFSLISENEVRLKWTPPENPNGKIKSYYVSYWKSSEDRSSAIRAPLSSTLLFFTANGESATPIFTTAFLATTYEHFFNRKYSLSKLPISYLLLTVPVHAPPMPTRNDTARYGAESIAIRWDTEPAREDDDAPVRFVQVEYQKSNRDDWTPVEKLISGQDGGAVILRLVPNSDYRFRIRYLGDNSQSVWSAESDWMKTLPAQPSAAPASLTASPYDSTSLLLQWNSPLREAWNADAIGYWVAFREYPLSADNDTWTTVEIPANSTWPERPQYLLHNLAR
ncbi:unnamed protein product [Strongylus vulgaris]|uniref:Fibronectin type-III domain-containing protein n=1 Tax=Strongylus vulgaris TaxID=40348 RepID=A0A3P7IU76_STRVU|nr:unnamed protein product [Strongylus vulgaris]